MNKEPVFRLKNYQCMFTRSTPNSNQQNTTNRLIELETKLQALTLENQQIKNDLRRLTNKSNINTTSIKERLSNIEVELTVENNNQQTPIQAIAVSNTATSLSRPFLINDRVKIKNPKKKQINTGTVIGYTAKGFIKILLDNNQGTVRRIPRNLIAIQRRL